MGIVVVIIIGVIVALIVVRLLANKMANGTNRTYLAHQVIEILFFAGALVCSFFAYEYKETLGEWRVNENFFALFVGLIFVGEFWGFSVLNEESHQAIQGRVSESIFGDELYYHEEEVTIRENTLFDTIWRAVLFSVMHVIFFFILANAYIEKDSFPVCWIPMGVSCLIRLGRILKLVSRISKENRYGY